MLQEEQPTHREQIHSSRKGGSHCHVVPRVDVILPASMLQPALVHVVEDSPWSDMVFSYFLYTGTAAHNMGFPAVGSDMSP